MENMRVAEFKKVSLEQFKKDMVDTFGHKYFDEEIEEFYNHIKLPVRATAGSAGHDISTPINIELDPGEKMLIPTGIRCKISPRYVMLIFPRSSMGIKKGLFISNTIPVVDEDYYNADNEGHIFLSVKNTSDKTLNIDAFNNIAQALFIPYGIADLNNVTAKRKGGVGSTGL